MKKGKGILIPLAVLTVASACSEVVELRSRGLDRTFIAVEALITDEADIEQAVVLSRSLSFFSAGETPAVSGADVRVSDGENEVTFVESADIPGRYIAPEGWCGSQGRTYRLDVIAEVDGRQRVCTASETMPKRGFTVSGMDYAHTAMDMTEISDSVWTVFVWGKDEPGKGYLTVNTAVNGCFRPIASGIAMDDTYFSGQSVAGFPVFMLGQTAEHQKKYGEAAKFLETGDVLRLTVYSMTKEYFEFISSVTSNTGASSIPLFSTRPANCPTNIEGEDAAGWFAVCAASSASRVVDDPMRKEILK